MKLCFHGAHYEYSPHDLEVTEGGNGGKYRGATWKVHNPNSRTLRHTAKKSEMIYRGVRYRRS